MRLHLIAALLIFLPAQSLSQDGDYEALFSALSRSESAEEAQVLSGQIWDHWLTAPNADAQAILDAALDRRANGDAEGMLAEINRLIEAYPDYAEGWNQRATLYFMVGDYENSLSDVEEVLAREPRHYGALAGRAIIYVRQGRVALAQIAVREALSYHPFLHERAILDIPVGDDL